MRARSNDEAAESRAQTFPDFVIAAGVFFLVVAFLVAFLPQMTAPYEDHSPPVVAERAAADLSGNLLTESGSTSTDLEEACTIAFFEGSGGEDCGFDADDPLTDRLGVDDRYRVNVTVRGNVSDGPSAEVRCSDGGSVGACGTEPLAAGPDVPGDRSVATARRVATVDGTYVVLEVSVWT